MKKFWVLFFTFFSIIFADDYQKFPIDEEKGSFTVEKSII